MECADILMINANYENTWRIYVQICHRFTTILTIVVSLFLTLNEFSKTFWPFKLVFLIINLKRYLFGLYLREQKTNDFHV